MKVSIPSAVMRRLLPTLTLFAGILAACGGVSAQPANGNGGPPKPSAEAMEACKQSTSGQACSFSSERGKAEGTCWAPEGKPLACKPKDAPSDQPRPPKQ